MTKLKILKNINNKEDFENAYYKWYKKKYEIINIKIMDDYAIIIYREEKKYISTWE